MNKKFTPYIYIAFFLCSFHGIFSQEITLKLIGKDSTETAVLNSLSFTEKHRLKKELYTEVNLVHEQVKKKGYFTSTIDRINKENDTLYAARFSLGRKTEQIVILTKALNSKFILKDSVQLAPQEVEKFIDDVLTKYDAEGKSFTELQLTKPTYKGDVLFLTLQVNESVYRNINKTIVKGYENFPRSYLKHHYKVDTTTVFSKEKLREVSNQTKLLPFVKEIKPPEVLFKQDSTLLYLFLDKQKSSSVDGIVNFASNEDGSGLFINGTIDLKLNNALNTGERFELFWNRVGEEKSEFNLKSDIPYLFNSPLSLGFNFNIYRQDSTFLNTRFNLALDYSLNSKSRVSLSYATESSDYLLDENDANFNSYSNNFFGVGYHYSQPSNVNIYPTKFQLSVTPSFGVRNSDAVRNNQYKIELSSLFNISTSERSYFNIRSSLGFLESKQLFFNELFRIGGANSLRGFNEQSIFTKAYSVTSTEFRYLVSQVSYIHSISDVGVYQSQTTNNLTTAFGVGFGYSFRLDNNLVNLGYAIGFEPKTSLDLNNSKLIVRWVTIF